MSFLSFGLINSHRDRNQFFLLLSCRSIYFIENFSGNIMAELTWQLVGTRPWIFVVLCNWFAGCDGKLPSEAIFHFRNSISTSW